MRHDLTLRGQARRLQPRRDRGAVERAAGQRPLDHPQRPLRRGAELGEPALDRGARQPAGQSVQPAEILHCDEVERPAQQPGRHERGLVDRRSRRGSAGPAARRAGPAPGRRAAAAPRRPPSAPPARAAAPRRAAGAARAASSRDDEPVAEVERVARRGSRRCARPRRRSRGRRAAPRPARPPRRPASARRPRCSRARRDRGTPLAGASTPSGTRRGSRAGSARPRTAPGRARPSPRAAAGRRAPRRACSRGRARTSRGPCCPTAAATTRRATRRSSRRPASWSGQWWSERIAIAASKAPSANGSAPATASMHRRRPRRPLRAHHRRRLDRGHVAVARLVVPGARADVKTVSASPSAARICAAIRGSSPRVASYERPIVS